MIRRRARRRAERRREQAFEAEAKRKLRMPANHPESYTRLLPDADEAWLAWADEQLFPEDAA